MRAFAHLVGLTALLGCALPQRDPSVTPAAAAAAGCYTVARPPVPRLVWRALPDTLALVAQRSAPTPADESVGLTVRTTLGYRQSDFGARRFTWHAQDDSLWIRHYASHDGREYRLRRDGRDWRGVLVEFTDVEVPDSTLPRWPVLLRRVACTGLNELERYRAA